MNEDNSLKADLGDRQRLYGDIFKKSQEALVQKLKTYPSKQEKLNFLHNVASKDILKRIQYIRAKCFEVECAKCGTCCKIASSEFNYEQLIEKANAGDNFAKSFTSTFVPYEDKARAELEFKDYTDLLKEKNLFDEVNFYYCPKLKPANEQGCFLCPDYKNRPEVCRDFPNNPLVIFPPKCAFNAWRDEFEVEALFLNAMIEIVGFFIEEFEREHS